jgi:hypothetical protein
MAFQLSGRLAALMAVGTAQLGDDERKSFTERTLV